MSTKSSAKVSLVIPTRMRCEDIFTFKSLQPCFVRSSIENNSGLYDPSIFERVKSGNLPLSIRHKLTTTSLLNCKNNNEMLQQLHELDMNRMKCITQLRPFTTSNKNKLKNILNTKELSRRSFITIATNHNKYFPKKSSENLLLPDDGYLRPYTNGSWGFIKKSSPKYENTTKLSLRRSNKENFPNEEPRNKLILSIYI